MSVFRERRIALLLLAVFLSIMLVWSPWRAVDSKMEGALGRPAQYTRGLHFGVDIIGGSRIILALEASHVTFEITQDDVENTWWRAIVPQLEDNLYVSIKTISFDPTTRQAVAEIGRSITENLIEAIIGDFGSVVRIEKRTTSETRDEVIEILGTRVDPTGLRGAQFRPLGANLVLYEIPGLLPGEAETLLGKPGRLEIFFENEVLLRGEDIVSVDVPYPSSERAQTADLPFRLTDDGAVRFRDAAAGKADYPTVIYVDRPTDVIVVFDNEILGELPTLLEYDLDEKMFKGSTGVGVGYSLRVSAIGTAKDELSPQARQFLEEQAGLKLKVRLLGDFSPSIVENLSALYTVESIPRLTLEGTDKSAEEWVKEACGLKSVVTITPELAADFAAGKIAKDLRITITRSSLDDAMNEARNLRVVLSERLPVEITVESETPIEARLGAEFLKQTLIVGIVALLGIWVLVYLRYRHLLIGLAIVGIMICELLITLGAASVLGWAIGLPELGGLIIVIGTGIDHQIIITDEVLRGGPPGTKVVSLSGRVSRAFAIIFVAVATTIAAMVSLAWLGFGAMRGFALITITGVLIAVLVTRPAYARIVSAIVMRVQPKAVSSQTKNPQTVSK
jgi:preprotein translocase subunit SecD